MSKQPNPPPSGYNSPGSAQDGTQPPYKPEDFSQQAINHGQRRINYRLAMGGLELVKAIEAFKTAIVNSSGGKKIDFTEVDKAIADVFKITNSVADIKPPGCDPS